MELNIFSYLYSLDPAGCEILFSLWLGIMFLLATPVFHDAVDWHLDERKKSKEEKIHGHG